MKTADEIIAGTRFRDRENGDAGTVLDIFTAYPEGIETLLMTVKFDTDKDTCCLDVGGFERYYEVI